MPMPYQLFFQKTALMARAGAVVLLAALFKINLTDFIQIPYHAFACFTYLFQIGSKRGHDPEENTCLLPLLGSGPFMDGLGCGYYRYIKKFCLISHLCFTYELKVIDVLYIQTSSW